MNKIFVIVGPTSSGKTSLSLDLCQKYNGEIISADSRQIYKYMDIGTGKVPIANNSDFSAVDGNWVVKGIDVWGYDLVNPDKFFSSFDYANLALPKMKEISAQGKQVFLVGGTGFYIDMVTGRTQPSLVEPDFELRKELEALNAEELVIKIKAVDEQALIGVDTNNPSRLMRTMEKLMCKKSRLSGLPYLKDTKYIYLGLAAPREILYKRADAWSEEIWNHGLIEETKLLIGLGYKDSPKMKGLIYKSVVDFTEGKASAEEALQRIKFDIHDYIRRQQTYFNKNKDIVWFDISKENYRENIYNFVEGQIKNG